MPKKCQYVEVSSNPKQFFALYLPLTLFIDAIISATKPAIKCAKCAKVKTYKNEPAALLPSPVK